MRATVWCSQTELAEHGELIEIGDRLHRTALPWEPPFLPPGSARWALDRYALIAGARPVWVDGTVAAVRRITGRVADERGLPRGVTLLEVPRAGGAEQTWRAPRDDEGVSDGRGGRWVAYVPRPGDELHLGWLLDLADVRVVAAPPSDAG